MLCSFSPWYSGGDFSMTLSIFNSGCKMPLELAEAGENILLEVKQFLSCFNPFPNTAF